MNSPNTKMTIVSIIVVVREMAILPAGITISNNGVINELKMMVYITKTILFPTNIVDKNDLG